MARQTTAASSQNATITPALSSKATTFLVSFRTRTGVGPGLFDFIVFTTNVLQIAGSHTSPYNMSAFVMTVSGSGAGPSTQLGPAGLGFPHKMAVVINGSGATSTGGFQTWMNGYVKHSAKITATTYTGTIYFASDNAGSYNSLHLQEFAIFNDVPVPPMALHAWFKGAPIQSLAAMGHVPSPNVWFHFGYGLNTTNSGDKNLAWGPSQAGPEYATMALGNAVNDFAPVNYNAGKLVGLRRGLNISAAIMARILYQDHPAAARVVG